MRFYLTNLEWRYLVLETTPEHPFYVNEIWVNAEDLTTGTVLTSLNDNNEIIALGTITQTERIEQEQMMYNLTVDTAHTFFVGEEGWLVHNTGPCLKILEGRQGKHIFGHPNFIEGNSVFTYSDPKELVNKFAGTGLPKNNIPFGQPGHVEVVDFGVDIGWVVDQYTGVATRTTKGTIRYANDGVHIVPANP